MPAGLIGMASSKFTSPDQTMEIKFVNVRWTTLASFHPLKLPVIAMYSSDLREPTLLRLLHAFFVCREWQSDIGLISNMSALPITSFNYGYMNEGSRAKISFGRLKCKGKTFPDVKGSSCQDLR